MHSRFLSLLIPKHYAPTLKGIMTPYVSPSTGSFLASLIALRSFRTVSRGDKGFLSVLMMSPNTFSLSDCSAFAFVTFIAFEAASVDSCSAFRLRYLIALHQYPHEKSERHQSQCRSRDLLGVCTAFQPLIHFFDFLQVNFTVTDRLDRLFDLMQ